MQTKQYYGYNNNTKCNNAKWLQWTMNNELWTMITITMNNDYNDNEQWQQCTAICYNIYNAYND